MPVYIYRCANCGVQFEKSQKFSDDPLKKCPECGKITLHKVITAPVSVIYKGSGFYSTDHRSNSGASTTARSVKESDEKKDASTEPVKEKKTTTETSKA